MKKVAIIGNGESRLECPFSDENLEIWATSTVRDLPRYDAIFELHPGFSDDEEGRARKEFLKRAQCPVYMQEEIEYIKNSVYYPLDRITENYRPYFTNSISYMIALAIIDGYKEIHIYGVSMEHDTEYGKQKASCEYWIGAAEMKGIKVIIAKASDLAKAYYLYGYEKHPMLAKAQEKLLVHKKRHDTLKEREDFCRDERLISQGRIEALSYFINYFG